MTDGGEGRAGSPAWRNGHADPAAVEPLRDRGERRGELVQFSEVPFSDVPLDDVSLGDVGEPRGPAEAAERRLREHLRSVLAAGCRRG